MRIHHLSDIHANHHVPFNSNQLKWEERTKAWFEEILDGIHGDVLILNGDFSEWNSQSLWLLEVASTHFNKVFFGLGNHDYYLLSKSQRKKYKTSLNRVNEFIEEACRIPNVSCLHGNVETYNGVTFAGETLWYGLKNPHDKWFYEYASNDSQYIHTGIPFIEDWKVLHDLSLNWYKSLNGQHVDVFVSHVPPVHPQLSNHDYNACYVTEVPFIEVKHWIAGHQHVSGTFEKADVTFHFNALGYPDEQGEKKIAVFDI